MDTGKSRVLFLSGVKLSVKMHNWSACDIVWRNYRWKHHAKIRSAVWRVFFNVALLFLIRNNKYFYLLNRIDNTRSDINGESACLFLEYTTGRKVVRLFWTISQTQCALCARVCCITHLNTYLRARVRINLTYHLCVQLR